MAQQQNDRETDESPPQSRASLAVEWAIAALGAALLLGTVIFLVTQAMQTHGKIPDFHVYSEAVTPLEHGHVVTVVAHNRGDVAAADVHIQGELRQGAEVLETRELTLDYVPSHSRTRGGLLFERNPAEHELRLRVSGYQKP